MKIQHAALCPGNAVIDEVKRLVGQRQSPILLLGVTPELAHAFDMVQAVDRNPAMFDSVWPGDTEFKKARVGDWLQLEDPDDSFLEVIGDGSLNSLTYPDDISWPIGILARLLSTGGIFACRLFERPTVPTTLDAILAAPRSPAKFNFHALKCMIATQLAAERGANVPADNAEFISTLQDGIAGLALRDCGNHPLASRCPILPFCRT
jgi:hypothetical protein